MQAIIEFSDFSFRYDSQVEPTLKSLTLKIYPGEKILVLGPSGSGKSTFAKCLNGLIPHAFEGEVTGELTLFGQAYNHQTISQLSYQVGTVLQDTSAQFVGLSVAEDVAFALENDQIASAEMGQRVDHWLEQMNLTTLAKRSPQLLSGGQKQRVSMAGVLIDRPEVLLFDEPLASLDPESGYQTMAFIEDIHQRENQTIIIIEHRLEEVLSQPVDRVIVFDQGEVVFDGRPDQLLQANLLQTVQIREPLYLSALKYAGVAPQTITAIDKLDQLQAPAIKDKLQAFAAGLPTKVSRPASPLLLTIEGLTYGYPGVAQAAIKDFSCSIQRGEMVSVVGTNGAGKSTLAKLIAGFDRPDAGRLTWLDQDITDQTISQRADKIGYVMQDPNQMISQTSLFDEVALGLRLRGYHEEQVEARVKEALTVCGLEAFRRWPISALSYGQKKRVSIAAILVLKPDLLILDEPTAGQDYKHYTDFMQFIQTLNASGVTMMMITHDLQLMLEYTDRTLVMTDGQKIADTTPHDVLTSERLTRLASLRQPSLYRLAKRFEVSQTKEFVANFIQFERQVRVSD